MRKRKVDHSSFYNTIKDAQTNLVNDKKIWSDEDTDDLMNSFLDGEDPNDTARNLVEFGKRAGRFAKGIERRLWSVATNYDGHDGMCKYTPGPGRRKRKGPLTINDLWVIKLAISTLGITWMAYDFHHLALVLGRDYWDFKDLMIKAATSPKGLIEFSEPFANDIEVAMALRDRMKELERDAGLV